MPGINIAITHRRRDDDTGVEMDTVYCSKMFDRCVGKFYIVFQRGHIRLDSDSAPTLPDNSVCHLVGCRFVNISNDNTCAFLAKS